MAVKRIGQQTIVLPNKPAILAGAAWVGPKEGKGPLGSLFDRVIEDESYGQQSFELAERQMVLDAARAAIRKAGVGEGELQFMLGGDLLNQIISASFAARELALPFLGLYGACSTMCEALCLGSMLLDGEYAGHALCTASSHFCTAERQYRFPLEYGNQRTPTAQWTVTGAGAAVLSLSPRQAPMARITHACVGRVVDLGVTDANNMGAAMAPAAADTLLALFEDTRTAPEDYDLIVTGDLGKVGRELLLELMHSQGRPLVESRCLDCGLMIYSPGQDCHAGGSGCGCSAVVLNACLLPRLQQGTLGRIVFMSTGALMSPTSSLQGESIPGVAHAVVLESPRAERNNRHEF
jgi:stage V sporulation protein AD